ncbi:MAG: fibrobacter succinogenes major paralogous domain-containing protein [Leadbetterella sp.]|nr:fibrobacter succinogenes major paralogous domain-containing protein [Leadbetterella sp.]
MNHILNINSLLFLLIRLSIGSNTFGQEEITFGTQTWMLHNLNVDVFRNGDKIPEAHSLEEWENYDKVKQSAWCYYNFDKNNEIKYGKLYNWYAVNDPRNVAPQNWRIPSNMEWEKLILFFEKTGSINKAVGNKTWDLKNNKLNQSGFWLFQLGGFIENYNMEDIQNEKFKLKGTSSKWWTAEGDYVTIHKKYRFPYRSVGNTKKYSAYSIRCIKN